MNKKFSTLLAGTLLAASTGAFAQATLGSFPVHNSVDNAGAIDMGDQVLLSAKLEYTKKDSLSLKGADVTDATKSMIDSLVFTISNREVAEVRQGAAKVVTYYTFTSKAGKFAFGKPDATKKYSNLKLNTAGEVNEWILPAEYLTTTRSLKGYAPYMIATRNADNTPKTVYVMVVQRAATNDAAAETMQLMEVEYDARLDADVNNNDGGVDKRGIKYTKEKVGVWSSANGEATHLLVTINGWKVTSNSLAVKGNVYGVDGKLTTASNAEGILKYTNPSFDFITTNDVNGTEKNLLAAYNWELVATPAKGTAATSGSVYMRAIGAKQKGTNRDLYLTVDTAYYDKVNKTSLKLALDTLPCDGSYTYDATKMVRNKLTYEFKVNGFYGSDSVAISSTNLPKMTGDYFKQDGAVIDIVNPAPSTGEDQVLIIKNFGGQRVLTPKHNGDATKATLITPSEFPTFELIDNPIAQFTTGGVFNIFDMNKKSLDGKSDNANYGKAIIIDNVNSRIGQIFVKSDKFDGTLPSHQWMATKVNNVYTFMNRETAAPLVATNGDDRDAATGLTARTNLKDAQLYTVDADKNIYTYGDCKDTIKIEPVTTTLSPFDGYKHLTREEQMNQTYNLRFVGELLGDEAFVEQGADSVMKVAIGNKDQKAEIRLLDVFADQNVSTSKTDTIKLGVKDHELSIVTYAVKIGRYYLAYDSEKKVYRFTQKQWNEAEAEEPYTYDRFAVTKLVGGNIALIPYETLFVDGAKRKLAIDSENGNAVRVELGSDLRHAFVLTPAEQGIFAQVTDSALTSIKIKSVENLGWSVAKGADDFIYEGVPSALKAGGAEYDKTAFDFKLDTAYVNREGNTRPLYYITYGAARHDSTYIKHEHNVPDHVCPGYAVNDTISGKYLFIMQDSIGTNRANELKYSYIYNDQHFAKLQFLNAKHVKDTLIANIGRPAPLAMDTMKAGKIDAATRPEWRQTDWLAGNNNKALFAFRINMDNKEEYAIYNPTTGLYITYLNGFVVASKDAAFYTLKDDEGFNVGNETIEGASTVSVIAKVGAVEIVGAQGKKVVISNILGQIIANTVITSDNATIAVPKGIVVVAVEGEEAVKAIVK